MDNVLELHIQRVNTINEYLVTAEVKEASVPFSPGEGINLYSYSRKMCYFNLKSLKNKLHFRQRMHFEIKFPV